MLERLLRYYRNFSKSKILWLLFFLGGCYLRSVKLPIGILLILSISVAALSVLPGVWAQQEGTSSSISAAKSRLIQCYDAAKAAESSGANISQLTLRLNSAGLLLSQAELAYSESDFGSSQSLAAKSQNELIDFISSAQSLQVSAAQSRTFDFLLNVVASVVGTILVILASVVVWIRLKRKYEISEEQKSEPDAV